MLLALKRVPGEIDELERQLRRGAVGRPAAAPISRRLSAAISERYVADDFLRDDKRTVDRRAPATARAMKATLQR